VFSVPVAGSPSRGPANAMVTIVLSCQYSGPYCNKIRPTIDRLFRNYHRKIRVVYKHFPVHVTRGMPSHLGACAAHRQGKFRAMHNGLWQQLYPSAQFSASDVRTLAKSIGLNMTRYDRDIRGVCPGIIRTDQTMLTQRGARGTPAWFINGRKIGGARPYATIKTYVDGELALAKKRIRRGTRARDYYRTWVVNKGIKHAVPPPRARLRPPVPRRPRPKRPDPKKVYSVRVGASPFIGPADAKVTLVVNVDFSSPWSDRIRATFEQLHKRYKNDLRIVFKHFVVYRHVSTLPALAACAAQMQGKFFRMETLIWTLPRRGMTQARLDAVASQAGLNMRRYHRDMKRACPKVIAADKAEFTRLGVAGVPGSFINGRYLGGARPVSHFEKLINEELAVANRRIRRGRASKRTYYRKYIERRGRRRP